MTDDWRARRALTFGIVAAALSALGTYLWLVSLVLYPIFLGLHLLVSRHVRSVTSPRPGATMGCSLSTAALLMPSLGWLGLVWASLGHGYQPGRLYGPAVTVLYFCVIIGMVKIRHSAT